MVISKAQQKELANLARAANRRLERAGKEQRSTLEYYLRKYHTREGSRGLVFKQGQAKTEREYRARMAELRAFMGTEEQPSISSIRRWEEVKAANLSAGIEKLRSKRKGGQLSDAEIAQVIKETGGKKKAGKAFYTALSNVRAAKRKKNKGKGKTDSLTGLTDEEISAAINSRRSEYQATLASIKEEANE